MIILGWICVISWAFAGAVFLSNYFIETIDFERKTGKIKGEIETTMGEDRIVSASFYLEDDPIEYGIVGKLFHKGDSEGILALEEGDEVVFHVKTEEGMTFWEKGLSDTKIHVGSIGLKNQTPFFSLDDTIEFRRSISTLVFAGLFFAAAIGLAVFLW